MGYNSSLRSAIGKRLALLAWSRLTRYLRNSLLQKMTGRSPVCAECRRDQGARFTQVSCIEWVCEDCFWHKGYAKYAFTEPKFEG